MIDKSRLLKAIDFAMQAPDNIFIHYEQDIEKPYPTSVYVEISIRRGMLRIAVKNFGGFENSKLTREARTILRDHTLTENKE